MPPVLPLTGRAAPRATQRLTNGLETPPVALRMSFKPPVFADVTAAAARLAATRSLH
eukprot:COSAG06_NODE_38254_length_425_cov_1.420245_1_plen_56_part_10